MTISVIIPTYHRPEFLLEAVHSVWNQTLLPDEILIGDDSKDDSTEILVSEKLIPVSPVPIRYFRNNPPLKQAKNVDFLIKNVVSDLLLLLHDDDLLMPNSLEILLKPLIEHQDVTASFGHQYLISEDGSLIAGAEKELNQKYYRTADRTGIVDGEWAAIVQMFPNDAFLVRTQKAQSIGCYDEGRAGDAVDFYFGFRLGKNNTFYLLDEMTAKYRVSNQSVSGSGSTELMSSTLKILFEDLTMEKLNTKEVKKKIKELMNPAISEVIRSGDKKTAMKWMLSSYYNLFTPKGFKRMLMLINPFPL